MSENVEAGVVERLLNRSAAKCVLRREHELHAAALDLLCLDGVHWGVARNVCLDDGQRQQECGCDDAGWPRLHL